MTDERAAVVNLMEAFFLRAGEGRFFAAMTAEIVADAAVKLAAISVQAEGWYTSPTEYARKWIEDGEREGTTT